MRIEGKLGNTMKVLGAYSGFPVSIDDTSIALAHMYGFWELKVPTKLPLNDLKAIAIKRMSPDTTDEKIEALIHQAKQYAKSVRKKVNVTRSFDQVGFESAKAWSPSLPPDRKPYEHIRLDFKP